MFRYEVSYRENGILKNKGFSYKDQFDSFMVKLGKKKGITEVRTLDNTKPAETASVQKLGKIIGKRLNIKKQGE